MRVILKWIQLFPLIFGLEQLLGSYFVGLTALSFLKFSDLSWSYRCFQQIVRVVNPGLMHYRPRWLITRSLFLTCFLLQIQHNMRNQRICSKLYKRGSYFLGLIFKFSIYDSFFFHSLTPCNLLVQTPYPVIIYLYFVVPIIFNQRFFRSKYLRIYFWYVPM